MPLFFTREPNLYYMKFTSPIPIQELAQFIQAELIGETQLIATGINEIHKVEKGDITFVDVEKYFDKSIQSKASIIIFNKKVDCPVGKALLLCENPFEAYDKIVRKHRPFQALSSPISDSAIIHPSTVIEPNVVIGHHVKIGKYCHIQANVTISDYTIIGDHVTIQSGTVIGTDAFYFKRYPDQYKKWRSGGRVLIEDHVDIGACCTINKGVSGDTIIGEGTKMDCQVHIGHGVVVGKHCLFAAQVGIAGKSIIEDEVVLYGQVGIAQNVRIGKKAIFFAKSGTSKSMPGGKSYFGAPAIEAPARYREIIAVRNLPQFMRDYKKK